MEKLGAKIIAIMYFYIHKTNFQISHFHDIFEGRELNTVCNNNT